MKKMPQFFAVSSVAALAIAPFSVHANDTLDVTIYNDVSHEKTGWFCHDQSQRLVVTVECGGRKDSFPTGARPEDGMTKGTGYHVSTLDCPGGATSGQGISIIAADYYVRKGNEGCDFGVLENVPLDASCNNIVLSSGSLNNIHITRDSNDGTASCKLVN
jgi:hypothetical protein